DIAARGIKLVALPGDYTDDGQPLHLAGLQRILQWYTNTYGIEFFITTGNHDPVGPFAQHAGKSDFLGTGGKQQPIYSKAGMHKAQLNDLPVVITADIATMGYTGITQYLGGFGFLPKENYRYWATPYSTYTYNDYTFKDAKAQGTLQNRQYDVAPGFTVPDASYVAEPVEGLWLLAIDGNTYIPKDSNGNPAESSNYRGADLGYNNVLSNKAHIINWVKSIAAEAKRLNKTLVAFSHYPMVDFNDGASPQIAQFMGRNKWQLNRVPIEAVAQIFADAGITIHFGGHMHINDTGIRTTAAGNTLLNVQTPSLAAYIPAYKLLTLHGTTAEIETITIDDVKGFDVLFPLYEMEYAYLKSTGKKDIWNKEILKTKSYHAFTDFHLKELVRLRFLPDDWHKDFAAFLDGLSGAELLTLANLQGDADIKDVVGNRASHKKAWAAAETLAKQKAKEAGVAWNTLSKWKGADVIIDFYRIRSADELALADISRERIA
ncbi:MAG: metallophosphoesterase, partial [Sphingobacteriales bacterium]